MVRANKQARIVQLPWSLSGMLFGRYTLQSGKRLFEIRWKGEWYRRAQQTQRTEPVPLFVEGARSYWWFHDCIYWDDDQLSAEDIRALVFQRERAAARKLQTAHSLMRAEEGGQQTRVAIPTELRRVVFERDGGQCVECESRFDLQYDHVLPVALGGATTVENLQLLCADCNQRKGASL